VAVLGLLALTLRQLLAELAVTAYNLQSPEPPRTTLAAAAALFSHLVAVRSMAVLAVKAAAVVALLTKLAPSQ
jgi:hypothetical protein